MGMMRLQFLMSRLVLVPLAQALHQQHALETKEE
jgi:hypothetical protein